MRVIERVITILVLSLGVIIAPYSYGAPASNQLIAGSSKSAMIGNKANSWFCLTGGGNEFYQRLGYDENGLPIIFLSAAGVSYGHNGSSIGSSVTYFTGGSAVLTFDTLAQKTGSIAWDHSQSTGDNFPTFSNYNESYDSKTYTLNVSFSFIFPHCTVTYFATFHSP